MSVPTYNYQSSPCFPEFGSSAATEIETLRTKVAALEAELANIKEVEFPKRVAKVAESWRGKCERLESENAALREGLGEPVAWEWKRTHQTGGYTREVTVSHQQALDWAADSSNLHQQDTVTPLYARKEKV